MASKSSTDIICFIRINLTCSEFYADSEKLADVCFKTIFAARFRKKWDASFGKMVRAFLREMTHIIIHEEITKKPKAKLFTTTDLLKVYLFTLNM